MPMSSPVVIKRTYPWTQTFNGKEITFRLMTDADQLAILRLARSLPEADLAFLRTDITRPEVVDAWIENIRRGRTITVVAELNGQIIGYGSLHHDETKWTAHLGEIRLVVNKRYRSMGLGRLLAAEIFFIAHEMKLERIICQIPADQPRVRQMFESLGFNAEAYLSEWLMSRDGTMHDLLILSQQTEHFTAR